MFKKLTRSESHLVKPGPEGDRQRAEALEEQVKILSNTASAAVDRASELEEELKNLRTLSGSSSMDSIKSHTSMNSVFSARSSSGSFSDEDSYDDKIIQTKLSQVDQSDRSGRLEDREVRLRRLETALEAIHRARAELNDPRHYRYI